MKPGTKLAILLISCVAMWGGIGYAFHYFGQPSKRAQSVAEKALMASVDNPESVKVIAVSKPDSVFGRNYINNDEKMAIAMSMMKVNEQVMSRTDGLQNLNLRTTPFPSLSAARCRRCPLSARWWALRLLTLHASRSPAGK